MNEIKLNFDEIGEFIDACIFLNGKDYDLTMRSLACHNKSNELFDFNYKHLCITVLNKDGKCYVNRCFDVYNDNGIFLHTSTIRTDKEYEQAN